MSHALAGVAGFEPTNGGIKTRCLTAWLYPNKVVSPLGFEPKTHGLEGRCSIQLSYGPTLIPRDIRRSFKKNGADDENRTHTTSLEGWSSAIELHPQIWSGRRDSNSRPSPWQGDALPLSHFRKFGRGRWIRTIESSANGFTVRPLWPLGNPSKWSWRSESNQQPADYKSAALPLSHASIYSCQKTNWRPEPGSNR